MRTPRPAGRHWLGAAVTAELAIAIFVAVADGPPPALPDVALGSLTLLYAEKAVALFVLLLVPLTILVRAFDGQLPIELRGMRWEEVRAARRDTMSAVANVRSEVEELQERLYTLEAVAFPPDAS